MDSMDSLNRMICHPRTTTNGLTARFAQRVANGEIPRGYDRLSCKQRLLIQLLAEGETVNAACERCGVKPDTFYRWKHAHKIFGAVLRERTTEQIRQLTLRRPYLLRRAEQTITEALDSRNIRTRLRAAASLLGSIATDAMR
jgi:transposase-like protein